MHINFSTKQKKWNWLRKTCPIRRFTRECRKKWTRKILDPNTFPAVPLYLWRGKTQLFDWSFYERMTWLVLWCINSRCNSVRFVWLSNHYQKASKTCQKNQFKRRIKKNAKSFSTLNCFSILNQIYADDFTLRGVFRALSNSCKIT